MFAHKGKTRGSHVQQTPALCFKKLNRIAKTVPTNISLVHVLQSVLMNASSCSYLMLETVNMQGDSSLVADGCVWTILTACLL